MARKKIDGSREDLGTRYGPDSKYDHPPGDYVLIAGMDQATAEAPFSLKAGETTELSVPLDAGVLAITAPGASFIEVFAAKKDIQGNRKPFGNAYTEMHQTTLPAGDYAIVVTMAGDNAAKKEATATV